MAVSNGQLANQTTFNEAFWSKDTATTGVAVYTVANTDTASGDSVANIQKEFNAIRSYLGGSLDQSKDDIPSWSSNNIGASGNNVFQRVEAIQDQVETNESDITTLQNDALTWTKYTFSYTDFSTAATSNEIEVANVDAGTIVHGAVIKHTANFGGGSISAYNLSVGPSGSATDYVDSFDVFQSVASSAFQSATLQEVTDFATTSVVAIQAVSTGDDLDQAASGNVDVWLLTAVLG